MNKKKNKDFKNKYNIKWVIVITMWTFVMAIIFSMLTEGLVNNINIFLAILILLVIILIGVFFDTIGIAVTVGEEKPFHSMAANKMEEAKYAIRLVRNASQVSNFCNDVIGDISGIVSGAVGTTIIYVIIDTYSIINGSFLSIIITSLIAAITVGGKAFGKSVAILHSEKIIIKLAKVLNFLEKKFDVEILPNKKKNKNR